MLIFNSKLNSDFAMKKYFLRAIVTAVICAIIWLILNLISKDAHSFSEYAVEAAIIGVISGILSVATHILDDKGWNSWKKIGGLFKRKKADD